MRLFALFLCMFLFLLCGGTLAYVYILWFTYWQQLSKYSYEDSLRDNANLQKSNSVNFRRVVPMNPAPQQQEKQEILEKSEKIEMDLPMDKLLMHVKHYKTQIVSQLRSAVIGMCAFPMSSNL